MLPFLRVFRKPKNKITKTYTIDLNSDLIYSFRDGKLKKLDIRDLSQFFTESFYEAIQAFRELQPDWASGGDHQFTLRKNITVHSCDRRGYAEHLVRSESWCLFGNEKLILNTSNNTGERDGDINTPNQK